MAPGGQTIVVIIKADKRIVLVSARLFPKHFIHINSFNAHMMGQIQLLSVFTCVEIKAQQNKKLSQATQLHSGGASKILCSFFLYVPRRRQSHIKEVYAG